MYEFVRGPLLWVAFIVFIGGMLYRVISFVSLSLKKDKVIYNHFSGKWALRSIIHWLLPLNHTARQYPVYTLMAYIFHVLLLFVPVFLLAHIILWEESWKISWWSLPESLADYLTLAMLGVVVFLIIRRMTLPYVRIVTSPTDYLLLVAVGLPFLTGYIAYHQWISYKLVLIIHILSGELMLVLIPFTKLSHMIMFFFSRAHIGMEFGERRGTVTW
jgi:nitrate reductase gamma subunit